MTGSPNPELSKLLDSFVCVRLVQMGGVDLWQFEFDPFLSWSLFFMNADKTIYGRFGTASPLTKRNKKDSNPNHSSLGLFAAMLGALALHRDYSSDPEGYAKRFASKTGPKPRWKTIESNPAARKYKRLHRMKGSNPRDCAHCHEVQRTKIDSYLLTGKRIPDKELWLYPSPSVLGLSLSRDHSARVTRVAKNSDAARAGIKLGDDILTLGSQPLVSIADVQFALQHFPDAGGKLDLQVRRADKSLDLHLMLPKLWRRACSDLNLKPARCMYVGDRGLRDVDPANALGMITVRLRRGGKYQDERGETTPDHEITHYDQLRALLIADHGLDLPAADPSADDAA